MHTHYSNKKAMDANKMVLKNRIGLVTFFILRTKAYQNVKLIVWQGLLCAFQKIGRENRTQ